MEVALMIRTKERDVYDGMWQMPEYSENSPGQRVAGIFAALAGPGGSVLDAGAGSGKGALALSEAGYAVSMCDLSGEGLVEEVRHLPFSEVCLWDDLRHLGWFDWVYCCDVLEHLPECFTMLAVARMLALCRRGVFLSVNFEEDGHGVFAGRPLHQTVRPFQWWREHLSEIAYIVEARDLIGSGTFLIAPKREVK
jgi:hypothetical protein